MLVLTRKISEKIIIDGPCVIEIVKVQGKRVSIGFVASPDVSIKREEIANVVIERNPQPNEGADSHAKNGDPSSTVQRLLHASGD